MPQQLLAALGLAPNISIGFMDALQLASGAQPYVAPLYDPYGTYYPAPVIGQAQVRRMDALASLQSSA